MPFVKRAKPEADEVIDGAERRVILAAADTADSRVTIDRWNVPAGRDVALAVTQGAICWIEVQDGLGTLDGQKFDRHSLAMLPAGLSGRFTAERPCELLISTVPNASRFGPAHSTPPDLRVLDWSREPVLQSEHDSRQRIYVLTEALFGVSSVKGEIIRYPDGASCPPHHHEGAEHYQYILEGSAKAVIAGKEITLNAGDLLYNFADEQHWFYNDSGADLRFVEYFIPGHCKTVWAPQAEVCAWLPTGSDTAGRVPVREIAAHVHGDATRV